MSKCEYCGGWFTDHNYEFLARECYPIQIKYLQAKIEEATDLIKRFHGAYEAQDADNFTDQMRDVYAAADLLLTIGNRD